MDTGWVGVTLRTPLRPSALTRIFVANACVRRLVGDSEKEKINVIQGFLLAFLWVMLEGARIQWGFKSACVRACVCLRHTHTCTHYTGIQNSGNRQRGTQRPADFWEFGKTSRRCMAKSRTLFLQRGKLSSGWWRAYSSSHSQMRTPPSCSSACTEADASFFNSPKSFRKESLCLCSSPGEKGLGCK